MVTFEVHELDPGAITVEGGWVGPLLAIPIVDCARLNRKTARPDHVQTNLNIRGFSAHLQAVAILNAAPATTNSRGDPSNSMGPCLLEWDEKSQSQESVYGLVVLQPC